VSALGDEPSEPVGDPAPSPSAAVFGQAALPGCIVPLPAGGRCPSDVECFGPVEEGRAERVACTGRHTWEAWAVGDLPASVKATDHAAVVASPVVRQVCGPTAFTSVTLLMSAQGWEFEVLPPEPDGDRTFRCLAGKGENALAEPTLFK
jgi:eukaryotic-like serine/threonine-protein kinase